MCACDDAVWPRQHLFHDGCVGQHGNDHVAQGGDLAWQVSALCPCRHEFGGHICVAILHHYGETCFQQIMRHWAAHDAEADEANGDWDCSCCHRHITFRSQ